MNSNDFYEHNDNNETQHTYQQVRGGGYSGNKEE